MKKRLFGLFFTLLWLLMCGTSPALAQKITVVESTDIKPYDDALRGFMDNCQADYDKIVLDEPDTYNNIMKTLNDQKPDLVLTIGLRAFNSVRAYTGAPIIYTMVSNVRDLGLTGRNVTGVSMNVSARKQLQALLKAMPGIKRIGIVYDPSKTGQLFVQAEEAARAMGISIVSRKVSRHSEAPDAIKDIADDVDAFWMLPDTTVLTAETIEYLLLTSFQHQAPVLTFSGKYLEMGAFISLGIDAYDIGAQACDMAARIISSKSVEGVVPESPRKTIVKVNEKVRQKFMPRAEEQATSQRALVAH